LTLENPPVTFRLKLNGLKQNSDGLYKLSDLQQRFQTAIDAYDEFLDAQKAAA
jgi:glucose-1-phosphatase